MGTTTALVLMDVVKNSPFANLLLLFALLEQVDILC